MSWQKRLNDTVLRLVALERRFDPYFRPAVDAVLRPVVQAVVQAELNRRRAGDAPARAEERTLPGEVEATEEIIDLMSRFLAREYRPGQAQRAGNTKTYGVVKGTLRIDADLPFPLRRGLFAHPATYPAWVRFAGPGPSAPPDLEDNGILSIGVKVVGAPGVKLLDDERHTQDFTGISAPTFTTPDVVENAKLQRQIWNGTPLWYFVNPRDNHLADLVMQGLYARTHSSPLETSYWSCAAYLLGKDRAMQYRFVPRDSRRSRVPWNPPDDYLSQALQRTLRAREAVFDMLLQVQTDPARMPIEDGSIVWPESSSPAVKVATLTLAVQEFDPAEQRARADSLSINPWHTVAENRPLGNQNRARRQIYQHLSQLRQDMNSVKHVEPGPEHFFPAKEGRA